MQIYKQLSPSEAQLIIAPGDSPYKYIQVMKLMGWELPPIVTFPLSGLGQPEYDILTDDAKNILDNYLAYVMKDYQVDLMAK